MLYFSTYRFLKISNSINVYLDSKKSIQKTLLVKTSDQSSSRLLKFDRNLRITTAFHLERQFPTSTSYFDASEISADGTDTVPRLVQVSQALQDATRPSHARAPSMSN